MSTEQWTRRAHAHGRRKRAFVSAFALTLGVLAVVGLVGAAAGVAQGPRVTGVQLDAKAATQSSGARFIVTTNQSLEKIHASQVEVSPATSFTVDTAGRSVGLRFTLPLRDATDYTVRITGVTAVGAGQATSIQQRFRTPDLSVYLLQRSTSGDRIVRSDLSGAGEVMMFTAPHIEDFRATSSHLAVATIDDAGNSHLLVTDLDGRHQRDLRLPGTGTILSLQAADRGDLIGYVFTDADIGHGGTRENALFIASTKDADRDADPRPVAIAASEKRILDWRFVPDTDSILVFTYAARMLLSGADGVNATDLGSGVGIDGIARGSSQAIVQQVERIAVVDLTDGTTKALVAAKGVEGIEGVVTPIPGDGAGTVRQYYVEAASFDDQVTRVYRVAADGTTQTLLTAPSTDAVLQTCVSPSGRYAAVLVAPHVVDNPYDSYHLPMPATLETHVIELATGAPVHTFSGFDLSWCQVPPPLSQ